MKPIAAATCLPALVVAFSLVSSVLPANAATITLDETDPITILQCGPPSCYEVRLVEIEGFLIHPFYSQHFHTEYSGFVSFFYYDGSGIAITRADGGTFTPINASITKRYPENPVLFNGTLEALPFTIFEGPEWQDITRLTLTFGPGPITGLDPGVFVLSLTTQVPEPSLLLLALVGGVACLRRHQRSRSQSS